MILKERLNTHIEEREINSLIPRAVTIANGSANKIYCSNQIEQDNNWNHIYHQTMNRLAKERGLRI